MAHVQVWMYVVGKWGWASLCVVRLVEGVSGRTWVFKRSFSAPRFLIVQNTFENYPADFFLE